MNDKKLFIITNRLVLSFVYNNNYTAVGVRTSRYWSLKNNQTYNSDKINKKKIIHI